MGQHEEMVGFRASPTGFYIVLSFFFTLMPITIPYTNYQGKDFDLCAFACFVWTLYGLSRFMVFLHEWIILRQIFLLHILALFFPEKI
jgi:hypothetical protein